MMLRVIKTIVMWTGNNHRDSIFFNLYRHPGMNYFFFLILVKPLQWSGDLNDVDNDDEDHEVGPSYHHYHHHWIDVVVLEWH